MSAEAKLQQLGITLPEQGTSKHSFVRVRQSGNLLFLSGQGPKKDGSFPYLGKLGSDLDVEQGRECARLCIINALAAAREYLGTLDRVTGVIKVLGFVASHPDFTNQPQVMNAASDLLLEVFGEKGHHARSAIGAPVLPGNMPVEIEIILEISE